MKIIIFDAGRRNHAQTGYGTISLQFGSRLNDMGYEVFYYDEHNYPDKVDMWLWIRPPHYVNYKEFDPSNINIFYTMHEKDTLDAHKAVWPTLLNKCSAIITPTEWNKKIWVDNGVTVPVHVVPLGVEPKIFRGAKTYEFSILSVFEGLGRDSSRELWKENIAAYFAKFNGKYCTEVIYTIKSWNMDWTRYRSFIKELIKEKGYDPLELPAINVADFDLVLADMNSLYAKHWLFLKNSRGEGWCLPAIEAMSAGIKVMSKPLPVMVYLNTSNCDYFNNYKQLEEIMWANWQSYRDSKLYINSFSWKASVNQLEYALKEIYERTEK